MAANNKRLSESELNAAYVALAQRFAAASDWRDYLRLADEYRELDTYKDSAQLYARCVKAASAPAYREITEKVKSGEISNADDLREAARVMGIIQDYQDARENMRVYTVKANVLDYDEAMNLVSKHGASCEDLERGLQLLRNVKGFRNSREMIERFEKYYFEKTYDAAVALETDGHVYSEFDEAADLFEKIAGYGDAAEHAAACRKKANRLRPKKTKEKKTDAADGDAAKMQTESQTVRRVKPDRKAAREAARAERAKNRDESTNGFIEVWKTLDKRRLVKCILWLVLLIVDMYLSVAMAAVDPEGTEFEHWIATHINSLRGAALAVAIVAVFFCVRNFLWMLTASMRKKLAKSLAALAKRVSAPLVRAVTKLLATIGIDLNRRNRLGGRDEKTIVYAENEKARSHKKRLKNDWKWSDLPDNAMRVRFIFIDFMIRRIRSGYKLRRTMTPLEIERDLPLEEDEKLLFETYQKARYAGKEASPEISDALIGQLKAVNTRKSANV